MGGEYPPGDRPTPIPDAIVTAVAAIGNVVADTSSDPGTPSVGVRGGGLTGVTGAAAPSGEAAIAASASVVASMRLKCVLEEWGRCCSDSRAGMPSTYVRFMCATVPMSGCFIPRRENDTQRRVRAQVCCALAAEKPSGMSLPLASSRPAFVRLLVEHAMQIGRLRRANTGDQHGCTCQLSCATHDQVAMGVTKDSRSGWLCHSAWLTTVGRHVHYSSPVGPVSGFGPVNTGCGLPPTTVIGRTLW